MPAASNVHSHDHAHAHPDTQSSQHAHSHTHTHAHGERHPAARVGFSLMRLSAVQRVLIVAPLVALLWMIALWVIWGGA